MDPGSAIDATAIIERESPNHTGEDTVTLASGGLLSRARRNSRDNDEETPLLARGGAVYHGDRRKSPASIVEEPIEDGDSAHWLGQDDFKGLPWWKRPSPLFLVPTFLLFTLAFGGSVALKFNLILDLVCRDYYSELVLIDPTFPVVPIDFNKSNAQCKVDEVQRRVVAFTLATSLVSGILSTIVAPKLGALSDRYGRKPILCFTSIGFITMEVVTIIAAAMPDRFPTNLILLSYVVDGLVGSFTAGMALSHAYVTDCSPPERRHVAFGQLHGSFFSGLAFGPLISAVVTERTGTSLTMFVAVLITHFVFLFVISVIVPESLSKRRQMLARQKHAEERAKSSTYTWKGFAKLRQLNFLEPLKILWPTEEGSSTALRVNIILISAIDMIVFGIAMGLVNVILAYQGKVFGWEQFEENIFMSVINIFRISVLFIILPTITWIVRRLSPPVGGAQRSAIPRGADSLDLGIIRVAILFDVLGYLGYVLVRDGRLFLLSGVVASVGGMTSPMLSGALTKHIPPEQTGQVLGAQGLLHGIVRVAGPLIFSGIYYATVGTYPQALWVCVTATFGMAFVLSLFLRKGLYLKTGDEMTDPSSLTPGVSDGQPEGSVGRD